MNEQGKRKGNADILGYPTNFSRHTAWMEFDGKYRKIFYDVLTADGRIIERCWPNNGLMVSTHGRDQIWRPGECRIRPQAIPEGKAFRLAERAA